MPAVASDVTKNAPHALMCEGSYGHSWMCNTIKSCLATDTTHQHPQQELTNYLCAPLEDVKNPVAWWGVCYIYLLVCLHERLTKLNIASLFAISNNGQDRERLPCNSGLNSCIGACILERRHYWYSTSQLIASRGLRGTAVT